MIDGRGDEPVSTDGPFVEAKEWAAGLWIIEAPDLDVALKLMAEGSKACNRQPEVRPLSCMGPRYGDPRRTKIVKTRAAGPF